MSNLIKKISAVIFVMTFIMLFAAVGSVEQNMITLNTGILAVTVNFVAMIISGKIAGAFEPMEGTE